MPPRHQQSDERKLRRIFLKHGRQQMAFHMVHADRRNIPGESQSLGAGSPHQQRSDQARACGVGNGVDLGGHAARLVQHLADQGQHALDVVPRGKLGYHPAKYAVQVDLAEQRVGQQTAFAVV
ncbi:hypothetical protein D3C73_1279800 [compost metagenome]